MLFWICFIFAYIPIKLLFPTKVIGRKNLPKGKCIVASNHFSNADAPVYDIAFAIKFRYMAKIELFKNKFVAFFLKAFGGFAVDREKITPSVYKRTMLELKKGHKVFIFPEGTRNKSDSDEMGNAKAGVITFASKGDVEIVPMMIYKKPKLFHKNYIVVGEPFKVQGQNPSRLTHEEVQKNLEIYEQKMAELRAVLNEKLNLKKRHKDGDI